MAASVELTIAETAYLAALPKGPSNYHPFRRAEAAIERRNWVIDRMVENGYVTKADGDEAKQQPLGVKLRRGGSHLFASDYFAEEVRRELGTEVVQPARAGDLLRFNDRRL